MKTKTGLILLASILIIGFAGCDISDKKMEINNQDQIESSLNIESTQIEESEFEGYGYSGTSPSKAFYAKKLIVIIMDGAANKGTIKTQVLNRLKDSYGVSFSYKWFYYTSPQNFSGINSRLDEGRQFFGVPASSIGVVLVGKSYGGARLYKYVYKNAAKLNTFYLTGVTYVDAHEPGAPADSGKCSSWYDWVIFRCDSDAAQGSGRYDHYDLYNNVASGLGHISSHYRQYNVYQRSDWPVKGYAFTRLGDRNHKVTAEHFGIENHSRTARKVNNSISFALGQHHNPY